MADKNTATKAKETLKNAGFNVTKAQILIIQELLKAKRPLSGKEIVQELGRNCPDKVTVYRIMEKFRAKDLVHRAFLGGRTWKYELARNCSEKQCHPHFTCVNCGQTFCLTGLSLPLIKGLKKGFVFLRQQVRIDGICSSCS